jgi:zinc protease
MTISKILVASAGLAGLLLTIGSGAHAGGFQAIQDIKTPGGIAFAFRVVPDDKRLAISVRWPVDLANAPIGQEALPYVASQLLFLGGSDGRSPSALKSEFKDFGAKFFIGAQDNHVFLNLVMPISSGLEAARIANLVLTKPDFDEKWLTRIKAMTVRALIQRRQFAGTKLALAVNRYVMGDHLYARTAPFASEAMITNVKRSSIVEWHRNSFVLQGMKVFAACACSPNVAGSAIDALLKSLPAAPTTPWLTSPVPSLRFDGKTVVIADPSAKKSIVAMYARIKWSKTLSAARTKIALDILGRGTQSRLFKALRSELGLSYGTNVRTSTIGQDVRLIVIATEVDTSKVALAVNTLHKAYAAFVDAGVTRKELDSSRDRALQLYERMAKSVWGAVGLTQSIRIYGFPDDYAQRIPSVFKRTTITQMNAHIAAVMPKRSEMLTFIITSNPKGIDANCTIRSHKEIDRCISKSQEDRS